MKKPLQYNSRLAISLADVLVRSGDAATAVVKETPIRRALQTRIEA